MVTGYYSRRNRDLKREQLRKEKGVCIQCGKKKPKKFKTCLGCRKKRRKNYRERRRILKLNKKRSFGVKNGNIERRSI